MLQYVKAFKVNACRLFSTAAVRTKAKAKNVVQNQPQPLISCKRSEFNLYVPNDVNAKFGSVPLASDGWLHHKSKNDFFIINATIDEEQRQAAMQPLQVFLDTLQIDLKQELLENLCTELNIKQLTDIQSKGIPKILSNDHVLIAAETGCGKTLTYLLPILQKIIEHKQTALYERKFNTPLALIMIPGRELATQISLVAEQLCKGTELKIKTILGGNTKRLMVDPEFEDVDLVVGTTGALSKLVTTGIYRTEEIRHIVLDEADTLLDESFSEKLVHFLKRFSFHLNQINDGRSVGTQLVLASATMPTNIEDLLHKVVDVKTIHEVVSPNLHKLMPNVEQRFLRMNKDGRPGKLLSIVKKELTRNHPLIVFSNKSATSDYVSIFLNNSGVNCLNLNGDMLMKIRRGRFKEFQDGTCDVLSTTDVGSRGLDTQRARHVINFDFPLHTSDYIHRCGRIGRVGNYQQCIISNFISSRREIDVVKRIEHAARTGGMLPNVNANIKGIINKRILNEVNASKANNPDEIF